MPVQIGFKQFLYGFSDIIQSLFTVYGYNYCLSSRFHQDALESIFCIVHSKVIRNLIQLWPDNL